MSRTGHEPAENHSSDRGAPAPGAGWHGSAAADDPLFGRLPTEPGRGSTPAWTPPTSAAPWHAPQAWQPRSPGGHPPEPAGPPAENPPDEGYSAGGFTDDDRFTDDDDLPDDDLSDDDQPGARQPADDLPDLDDLPDPDPRGAGPLDEGHHDLPDDDLPDGDLDDDLPDDDADWDERPAGRSWDWRSRDWSELSQSLAARVVAFVTVALVVAGIVILFAGGDGSPSGSDAAQTEARDVPPDFVNSIRSDSDPVVPGEFFGQQEVTLSGREYTRLNARLDNGCPELTGAASTPLTEANCRQLARAVYLSPPEPTGRTVLVGVSVFAVDEAATAKAAAEVFQTRQGGVIPLPVTPEQVPGATVLTPAGDNSWRQAITRGHYMIVLEAAYSDGNAGSPEDPPLRTAISDVEQLAVAPISDRARLGEGPPAPATTAPATPVAPATTAPAPTPAA